MPYQFATQRRDESDLAGGLVLYAQPGAPAFPVRLMDEIFQRSAHLAGWKQPVRLYDPCCGGAYHLAVLGILHGDQIAHITASDADPQALALARRNLALLTPAGLDEREAQLRALLEAYGKPSHADAIAAISRLRARLPRPIPSRTFLANALDPSALHPAVTDGEPGFLFADVPYGGLSAWQSPDRATNDDQPPLWHFLNALHPVVGHHTILAIAADKAQKAAHPAFRRVDQFQIGKRRITFLRLA